MLNIQHITKIDMFDGAGRVSEVWRRARLAKFTSSEWHYMMAETPFTVGAMNYIYRKVGEELTGLPCRDEVDTKATEHGKTFESAGIMAFGKVMGLEFVVTQKLITDPDSRFGGTPDFLVFHKESVDKKFWDVSTGEVKCPLSYDSYIALARCKTPEDVKKINKIYYWQVLSQMDLCDCLTGYLVIYHPYFKEGGLNIIEFRKLLLRDDFKLLNARKILTVEKFNEVRDELYNLKFN